MDERQRPTDEPAIDREQHAAPSTKNAGSAPGCTNHDLDEGPSAGGGSALAADEPAADEEVGGGD